MFCYIQSKCTLSERKKTMKYFWLRVCVCLGCCLSVNPLVATEDDPELEHECTSWLIFSDLTGNNTNILHKNRDSNERIILPILSPSGGAHKWIALGSGAANMGINDAGLAGVMNSGEKCINHSNDPKKKSTPVILQEILESCDTAAQAVNKMQQIIKAREYRHGQQKGSIFFFLDTKEGYICEMTAKECIAQRFTRGFAVRANIWQNPGMQKYSRNSIKAYLNSSARAYIAISGLNKALDSHGKITLEDIFDLSRHWKMPEESPQKRSVCFNKTNSTSSLEIDRQFPGVLSTGYFTVGHPRHTIYVPVPICVRKLHPAMSNLKWSAAAWKRFDALKLEAPFPEEWQSFERNSLNKYRKAREEARQLLVQGKKEEAVNLLNAAASAIWDEAAALLKL